MDEDLNSWLKDLNISDLDLKKLKIAFTHSSIKGLDRKVEDYERFEFLGDTVLDLVVSERLFKNPELDEDLLTKIRSNLVKTKPLSEIFDLIGIKPFIKYVGTDLKASMKEAVVEAFFGIIYTEKGYMKCQEVWDLIMQKTKYEQNVLDNFFNKEVTNTDNFNEEEQKMYNKLQEYYSIIQLNIKQNAVGVLQDLCQKQWRSEYLRPEYILVNQSGPPHDPLYEYKVTAKLNFKTLLFVDSSFEVLKDIQLVEGFGKSNNKKSAKMKAAQDACDKLYLSYI